MRHWLGVVAAVGLLGAACASSDVAGPPTPSSTLLVSPDNGHADGPTASLPPGSPTIPPSQATPVLSGPATMPPLHPSVDGYPQGRARIVLGDGMAWDIPVLLAASSTDRAHGLMEVADVPSATGMGFVFARDTAGGFWMKGTATDLDIAWFTVDGRVVAITTMTVCLTQSCPSYEPGAPYRYALEVRAGWFADIGLAVGDHITLRDAAGRTPVGA